MNEEDQQPKDTVYDIVLCNKIISRVGVRMKKTGGGAVLMEIWKDVGDSDNPPHANQWIKIKSWIEGPAPWKKPPEDHLP